jgi:putative Holliday junction resolvase
MAGEPPGRVLGLDLGQARIGVSISDPDRRLAVPFGTIHVGQPPGELKAIAAIVEEEDVTVVVMGLPLSMSGERGPAAVMADGFADTLRQVLRVPVEFQDERLTTAEAQRSLKAAGADSRSARAAVDRTAATVILQAWLDAQRS